jgi:hypothetical protein
MTERPHDWVARIDQLIPELSNWAQLLGHFRRSLTKRGFTSDQASVLCGVWFAGELESAALLDPQAAEDSEGDEE